MKIANPIYDVVFKYLMDDNRIAKFILSKIIDQKIETLDPCPQEIRKKVKQSFTIYRLDYSAKIKSENGEERVVLIEIQKAKFPSDIQRFRNYLGQQYSNSDNSRIIGYRKNGDEIREPLPIITIYFLGHELDHIKAPVISVKNELTDVFTKERITEKETFISCLNHEAYIIQIPYITNKRRTDLETLLSIFDQKNRDKNHHILNVKEEDFPIEYQEIIRRLQKAKEEESVEIEMTIEDQLLADLSALERENLWIKEELQKQLQKQETMIQEKDTVIQKKDSVIQEKDRALQEALKQIAELKKER